jgi:signal transduction histidine kinase
VYRDDGRGVLPADKDRIFELGHGMGGGLGLHLARQILEVTGMHIREVGEPGQGAVFEIVVPPERWRTGLRGERSAQPI